MSPLVVFDLDGTVIDSQQDLAESANLLLATYGAPPLEVAAVAGMVGDGARQLVSRVLAASRVDTDIDAALQQFLGIYADRLVVHTRPYDGMAAVLDTLAGWASLALVTNKPEGLSRRILDAFGFSPLFRVVVGGDSGFPRKPDPAGLRHVMTKTGTLPRDTAYVGDSMIDVETARAAGTAVVVAGYGFGRLRQPVVLRAGELEAGTPAELPSLLARGLGILNPT